MMLRGVEIVADLAAGRIHSAKMVFNDRGALFFPIDRQHRDEKTEGISYEDDYKGSALAAMLGRGRIEIRVHKSFSDHQVNSVLRALRARPELSAIADWQATYQGRPLPSGP